MAVTDQLVTVALQLGKMQAFGLAMPRLATDWLSVIGAGIGSIAADDASMTLTPNNANWCAPLDMHIYLVAFGQGAQMPVTLIDPSGAPDSADGVLLTLFDQPWLRLCRLYAQVLEDSTSTTRPEHGKGLPWRPVPKYFYFPGASTTIKQGVAEAGAPLGFAGPMRIYDGDGLPIDPVAVMAAFLAFQKKYAALEALDAGSQAPTTLPLETYLNTLAATQTTRLRLVSPDGSTYNGSHLTNIAAVSAGAGLYTVNAGQSVGLDAVDAASFPQEDHDRLVFGPATSGRLTNSFTPPTVPSGVTLKRDFFSLRVVSLTPYLVGEWPLKELDPKQPFKPVDPACGIQRQAAVRINENVAFLADGNDVYGAISTALPSGSDPALVVAQAIDGTFALPNSTGTNAHWPLWSLTSSVTVDAGVTLSIDLKTNLILTASWFAPSASDGTKADVVLQVQGLPTNPGNDTKNAWLRVYPRKFAPDATEERGDGQGGLVQSGGTIGLYLTDPLSLRDRHDASGTNIVVPPNASLMFDMIIVLPNGKSRIYGDLSVHIDPGPATAPTVSAGTNSCGTASYRGISKAGILGLGNPGLFSPSSSLPGNLVDWAKLLKDDVQPRDAPRLPTMARRELLAAGYNAGSWSGVIGGGRIAKEGICADARVGEPGGYGGRETILTGASTKGGILAYDIARHAFRRTTNIVDRMHALDDSKWDTPTAPTAVAVGSSASVNNGTFAGALLQTIAPYCETPELGILPFNSGSIVDAVKTWLEPKLQQVGVPQTVIDQVKTELDNLKTTPPAPASAVEDTSAKRLAVEAEREVSSAGYGRRDAQWSLQSAIKSARHFIYIETPGFCSTANPPPNILPGYAANLITTLAAQLLARPGLRLVICAPKYPDFAPGYEDFSAYEANDRLSILKGQTSPIVLAPQLSTAQSILFHPIGFPGRFSRVETNIVVVDDIWAMIGGSSLRRRGLTFDGSTDLVLTDTQLENGSSPAIRDFRRTLMAKRLGIANDSTQASYVALNKGTTAFALVRETLEARGLGKIAPVWNGERPGETTPTPSSSPAHANPDGREFDIAAALAITAIALTSSGP
jgi:hypothetical protein